jgi:crossover junction endodeoxyribonuclease RuvC
VRLRACAFDLSLTASGVAATHNHRGEAGLLARTVHTRRYVREGTDHRRIHDILVDLGAAVSCKPHVAVMEGAYVGQQNNTMELAGLRTVVGQWLWARGVPYAVVAPATLKVYATGSGATSGQNAVTKQDVRAAITATFGRLVHIGSDDEADAVALLAMTLDHYGQPLVDLPDSHRRALKSVRWPDIDPLTASAADTTAGGQGSKEGTR